VVKLPNRRIEQEFSRWARAANLAEKLRTMCMARAIEAVLEGLKKGASALR